MELEGSTYLYALATVSITFIGFSALLWIFRQTIGGGMTRYDGYFVISFILPGLIVVGGSLLPPLLALYGLQPEMVWRLSSGISSVPILLFVVTLPARRRKAVHEPIPFYIWLFLALQFLCALILLLTAADWLPHSGAAVYATSMAGMLLTTSFAYVAALGAVFEKHLKR